MSVRIHNADVVFPPVNWLTTADRLRVAVACTPMLLACTLMLPSVLPLRSGNA